MSLRPNLRRPRTWVLAAAGFVFVGAVVAPWLYINVIQGDPPERLSFEDVGATSDTTATAPDATTATSSIDGTWEVATGSVAGYRVGEVLFGQDTEAVGRTDDVTGSLVVDGTSVSAADLIVDLTTVSSDEDRRDNQFQGRIMNTAEFPTATFTLTDPIDLGDLPAELVEMTYTATGELTLRGTTRTVSFDLTARRDGDTIQVQGAVPVDFDEFGIPDASFGPATVQDHGEVEFVLVFQPA